MPPVLVRVCCDLALRAPPPAAAAPRRLPRRQRGPTQAPSPTTTEAGDHHDGPVGLRVPTPSPSAHLGPRLTPDLGRVGVAALRRGGRTGSAFSLGHARQHGCAQQPNAALQARGAAAATQERRLFPVACKRWLGLTFMACLRCMKSMARLLLFSLFFRHFTAVRSQYEFLRAKRSPLPPDRRGWPH